MSYTNHITEPALHRLAEKSKCLRAVDLGCGTVINTELLIAYVNRAVLTKLILDNVPQSRANDLNVSATASSNSLADLSEFSAHIFKTSLAPLLHTIPTLRRIIVAIVQYVEEDIDALYRPIVKTPTPSLTSESWSTPASVFRLEIPSLRWISSHRTPSFHTYHLNPSSPPRMSNKWPLGLLQQSVLTRPSAQHLCLSPLITSIGLIFQHFSLDERQFHRSSSTRRPFFATE